MFCRFGQSFYVYSCKYDCDYFCRQMSPPPTHTQTHTQICSHWHTGLTSVISDMAAFLLLTFIPSCDPQPLLSLRLSPTIPCPVHQSPPTQHPKQTLRSLKTSAKLQLCTTFKAADRQHTRSPTFTHKPRLCSNHTPLNRGVTVTAGFLSWPQRDGTTMHLSLNHKDHFYFHLYQKLNLFLKKASTFYPTKTGIICTQKKNKKSDET